MSSPRDNPRPMRCRMSRVPFGRVAPSARAPARIGAQAPRGARRFRRRIAHRSRRRPSRTRRSRRPSWSRSCVPNACPVRSTRRDVWLSSSARGSSACAAEASGRAAWWSCSRSSCVARIQALVSGGGHSPSRFYGDTTAATLAPLIARLTAPMTIPGVSTAGRISAARELPDG